ncbi:MAG: hypothetical protein P1U90_17435 [Akkermansiaceae bacterium]|nr:hypothetical protein [Akkermansiaceae bacterium]
MKPISLLLFLLIVSPQLPGAGLFIYEPTPYLSEEDSPFIQGIRAGTVYLEDFEDQALNTPFVTAPDNLGYFGTTVRADFPISTSSRGVDGDDGAIDGIVNLGDSWTTIDTSSFSVSRFKRFDFYPDEIGRLPSYVGIVVTEVRTLTDDVDAGVRNAVGDNLFAGGEFDPLEWFTEVGALRGDASTHRFIGFYAEEGIATLLVNNVSQVDHLQYGYAIPEPSTAFLSLLGLSLLARRRLPF